MDNKSSGGWRFLNGKLPAGGLLAGLDPYAPLSQDFSGLGNVNVPKAGQLTTLINTSKVDPLMLGQSSGGSGSGDKSASNNASSPFGDAMGFDSKAAATGAAKGFGAGGLIGGLLGGLTSGITYNDAIAQANAQVNAEQDAYNSPEGQAAVAQRDADAIADVGRAAAAEGYGNGVAGPAGVGEAGWGSDLGGDSNDAGASDDGGRDGHSGGPGAGNDGSDTGGSEGNYYKGGMVNKLHGPNPKGPDDGYAALKRKEGVLTVETVRRIGGKKAIDALNSGKAKIVMIG